MYHLDPVAGLRVLVALPAPAPRPILLIRRQPSHAVLAQEAMHRRASHRDLMKAAQIGGDPARAEVILLTQIQDPGPRFSVIVDVTPTTGMHVYAPGTQYRPIAIALDPDPLLTIHETRYPPPRT